MYLSLNISFTYITKVLVKSVTLDSYIDIVASYCPSIKYLVAVDSLGIFPSDGECFALEFLLAFRKIDRNLDLFHDLGGDQWPVA